MHARSRRSLLIALWTVAVVLGVFVLLAAQSGRGATARRACTHGLSSVGPVTVANGRAVRGSTTPHTQACLP